VPRPASRGSGDRNRLGPMPGETPKRDKDGEPPAGHEKERPNHKRRPGNLRKATRQVPRELTDTARTIAGDATAAKRLARERLRHGTDAVRAVLRGDWKTAGTKSVMTVLGVTGALLLALLVGLVAMGLLAVVASQHHTCPGSQDAGLLGPGGDGALYGMRMPNVDPQALVQSIDSFIAMTNRNSPFHGRGDYFVAGGSRTNVNPALAIAQAQIESQLGTSHYARTNNNAFGLGGSRPIHFSTMLASVDYFYSNNYLASPQRFSSLQQYVYLYAPPSENDSAGYIANVQSIMRKILGGLPTGDGSASGGDALAAVQPAGSASSAPDGTGSDGQSASAAKTFAQGRNGTVTFALVDGDELVAGSHPHQLVHGASMTKAMLLVARLRDLAGHGLTRGDETRLTAMIEHSDNAAANHVLGQVGLGAVRQVARLAGMTDSRFTTSDPEYRLGDSLVSAVDQARLFARIDDLIPARHRDWAMGLLENVVEGHWGILNATTGTVPSKAGWRSESSNAWTVTQAAQVTPTQGLAVLTANQPDQGYGEASIEGVAKKILANRPTGTSGSSSPCSDTAVPGSCKGGSYTGPTVAGPKAKVDMQTGVATPPDSAPEQVKCMIDAGNQIHRIHYVYGGCHGPPLIKPCSNAVGYDCSSSTSYVLYHGGVLRSKVALDSTGLESVGEAGRGQWVSWYANAGHVYSVIAGLRFDTGNGDGGAKAGPPGSGPRWSPSMRTGGGFAERHPRGL
jgi:hypothetical protein